jgi:hypothetical protein
MSGTFYSVREGGLEPPRPLKDTSTSRRFYALNVRFLEHLRR